MDLPYNPNRPHNNNLPHSPSSDSDDDKDEEDDEFDLEAFRRTYGGYTASLNPNGPKSEFWAKVRKGLRKRRRRLARRRKEKEREQAAYRAWKVQQAEEDAVLRRWGCGCVLVGGCVVS